MVVGARGGKIAMTPPPNTLNICGTCKKNVTASWRLREESRLEKLK